MSKVGIALFAGWAMPTLHSSDHSFNTVGVMLGLEQVPKYGFSERNPTNHHLVPTFLREN